MASLNQVSIELQVTGERQATQSLKRYSDASDKLTRSVLNAAGKIENTTNAWDRANKLFEKGILNSKGLQAAQTQLARELAVVNGYVKTNGALNTQKALAELKAVQATKAATAAEAQANAERQRAQQTYNQLRSVIDQSYAARMRLKKAADTLRAAERQGLITREQAIEQLRQYRALQQSTSVSVNNFGNANHHASRQMNGMGMAVQQTGYQVGDFLVQVQGGTNWMVAFGQQATQLVGILPMMGAQLGLSVTKLIGISTVLGIGIPLVTALGAAFMRTSGQSETLDEKLQKLETSFVDLNTSMDRIEDSELDQKFGNLTGDIESITLAMAGLNSAAAMDNLFNTFERMEEVAEAGVLKNIEEGFYNLGRIISPFHGEGTGLFGQMTPEDLDEEAFAKLGFDMARSQYVSYLDELQKLSSQGDVEGVTSLISDFFKDATDGAAEVSMQGMEIAQAMESAALRAAEFAANQNGSAEAARIAKEDASAQAEEQRIIVEEVIRQIEAQEIANQKIKELTAEISASHRAYTPLSLAAQEAKSATEKHVAEMAALFDNARDLKDELGDAAFEALRLAGVDMTSGINAAAMAASRLAADLNISLAAAMAMQSMASKEEQVMSQPVVQGSATDRFGTEDLLNMGYTEEYLKFIGKIRSGKSGGGRGRVSPKVTKTQEDYLAKLQSEADLKLKMIGLSDQEQRRLKITNELKEKGLPIEEARIQQILATESAIRKAEQAEKQREELMNVVSDNIERSLMGLIEGTKSVEDAFRSMLRNILLEIYNQQAAKPIASGISGFIGNIFGGAGATNAFGETNAFGGTPAQMMAGGGLYANGGAFNNGNVIPFANGGVVSSPTMFPMAGSQTGLMGEAGPEAIMPLKRGKGGKLGVVAEGGQQPVVINQSFNFSANGDESVKRIIAQEAPRIANLTQKQIIDQRRRGGTMKAAFG